MYHIGDEIEEIFFIQTGECSYALPRFNNLPYVRLVEGTYFGFQDIVAACLVQQDDQADLDNWFETTHYRTFSVRCTSEEVCQSLKLGLHSLNRIKIEFGYIYDQFIEKGLKDLQKHLGIKVQVIDRCNELHQEKK